MSTKTPIQADPVETRQRMHDAGATLYQEEPSWLRSQADALGRISRNFRKLAKKFRGAWRPALRKWWLVKTWPIHVRYGELLCMLNRHQDQEAPAVDKKGDFIPNIPGRYSQCQRPKCQRIRGRVTLLETDRVCEVPDLVALAFKNCRACGGRGYAAKMLLGPGKEGNKTRAKVPCQCIQVQPVFIEHMDEPAAPVDKAGNRANEARMAAAIAADDKVSKLGKARA